MENLDNNKVYEAIQNALNCCDENVERWSLWKKKMVYDKTQCLINLMEIEDRRQAGKI